MNARRCLSCRTPLPIGSRADCRTCTDLCRKRLSLARRADRPAPGAQGARQGSNPGPTGHRPTSAASRESRGLQP
jgi:hypothetical protein